MSDNMILVKVARIGQAVKEVSLAAGSSVRQALDAAGEDATNCTIKLRGQDVQLDSTLGDGAVIALVPNVKNGR